MRTTVAMWWTTLLVFFIPVISVKGEEISLGGLRNIKANIRTVGSDYEITVRFIPIKTFGKAINRKLNLGKGKKYALLALAHHLGNGSSVHLSVSGVLVDSQGKENNLYLVQVLIPRNTVISRKLPTSKSPSKSRYEIIKEASALKVDVSFKNKSPLLSRKQDYVDTISELHEYGNDSLLSLRSLTDEESFFNGIVDLEESITEQNKLIIRELSKDGFLLSNEREEIKKYMAKEQNTLLSNMRAVLKNKAFSESQKESN